MSQKMIGLRFWLTCGTHLDMAIPVYEATKILNDFIEGRLKEVVKIGPFERSGHFAIFKSSQIEAVHTLDLTPAQLQAAGAAPPAGGHGLLGDGAQGVRS